FLLLLEDLAPARCGDQVAGCSPEDAETAIRAIGKFHATWWESPRLEALAWMPLLDHFVAPYHDSFRKAWAPFVEKEGDRLPPAVRRIGEHLEACFPIAWEQLARPPRTIAHGDFRLDNLLFPPIPGGDSIAVVDWQGTRRGHGMFDAGYFLCESL